MRRTLALVLGGLALAGGHPATAGDPEAGRRVANMCRTCHGLDGYAAMPIAPHIGGEPAAYLVAQLTAYKTGAREHEMMTIVAGGLSEAQIADVAAWYASHEVTAALPAGAAEADAPALCVGCHGADGISVVPDAPNLAGEANIYTDTQLKAFRGGRRVHDVMSGIAADLSDAEIRAVADWYADVTLQITPPG